MDGMGFIPNDRGKKRLIEDTQDWQPRTGTTQSRSFRMLAQLTGTDYSKSGGWQWTRAQTPVMGARPGLPGLVGRVCVCVGGLLTACVLAGLLTAWTGLGTK